MLKLAWLTLPVLLIGWVLLQDVPLHPTTKPVAFARETRPPPARALLLSGAFEQLGKEMKAAYVRSFTDPDAETQLIHILSQLEQNDPALLPRINSFAADTKSAPFGHLVRIHYHLFGAWNARGFGSYDSVNAASREKLASSCTSVVNDVSTVLKKDPSQYLAHLALAECVMITPGVAHFDEMRSISDEYFTRAIKANPISYSTWSQFVRYSQPRWGGSIEKMSEIIERSQKHSSMNPRLRNLAAYLELERAMEFNSRNSSTEAYRVLHRIAMEIPTADIERYRSQSFLLMGDHDEALASIDRALESYPYLSKNIAHRALVLLKLKEYEIAESELENLRRLSSVSSDTVDVQRRLASALLFDAADHIKRKEKEEAERLIMWSERVMPTLPFLYRVKADLSIANGRHLEALVQAERATELNPFEISYVLLVDWLLAREKRFSDIVKAWNRFIERNPKVAQAYFERGGAHYHLKQFDLAKKDAKRACDLGHKEGCTALKRFGQQI